MRSPFHPSIEEVSVEAILHALSDPVRASIFAGITGQSCAQTCSSYLTVSEQPVPKSTLSQHFKILREAGLIRSERHGVEVLNTSRGEEVERRFPGLLCAVLTAYRQQSGPKKHMPSTTRNGSKKRSASR
jgi:DNA-binding transcriptional ArsR family regulator